MVRTIDLGDMLDLTARIYDAVLDDRLWPEVLNGVHHLFRSEGSVLNATRRDDDGHWVVGNPCDVPEPWTLLIAEDGFARLQVSRPLCDLPFSRDERRVFSLLGQHLKRAAHFRALSATSSMSGGGE